MLDGRRFKRNNTIIFDYAKLRDAIMAEDNLNVEIVHIAHFVEPVIVK